MTFDKTYLVFGQDHQDMITNQLHRMQYFPLTYQDGRLEFSLDGLALIRRIFRDDKIQALIDKPIK